jgi:hypothetical protein
LEKTCPARVSVTSGLLSVTQDHGNHVIDHSLKRMSLLAYREMRKDANYSNTQLREIFDKQLKLYPGISTLLDWTKIGNNLRKIRRQQIPPCTSISMFLDNIESNDIFKQRYNNLEGENTFVVS